MQVCSAADKATLIDSSHTILASDDTVASPSGLREWSVTIEKIEDVIAKDNEKEEKLAQDDKEEDAPVVAAEVPAPPFLPSTSRWRTKR